MSRHVRRKVFIQHTTVKKECSGKDIKMQERTIMIFPQFTDQEIINEIRQKYDPLYKLVKPHITLVFPFKNQMSDMILKQKLEECLKETASFPLVLQGISKHKDTYGNYIFLNITKGSQEIIEIHNSLYLHIFGEQYCQPYIPHMTIGNLDSTDKMEQAYNSLKNRDLCFTTVIEKISVEVIGANGESNIIIEKPLQPHYNT